jgi:putative membrane protein
VPGIAAAHVASSGVARDAGLDLAVAATPMVLAAALYIAGAVKLRRTRTHPPRQLLLRATAFACGLCVLAVALLSPLDSVSAELFFAHMIQHELIMLAAAPLLVLGHPLPIFLWSFPSRMRRAVSATLHRSPVRASWNVLSGALSAWLLHALALWVWHVPRFFNAALADRGIHDLQHLSFLAAALLFWSALFQARGADRRGAAIVYLFTTTLHTGVLGALIALASTPWYAEYLQPAAGWQLTALEDQQLGGLIMWVPGCIVYVGCALGLFARWVMSAGVVPTLTSGSAPPAATSPGHETPSPCG